MRIQSMSETDGKFVKEEQECHLVCPKCHRKTVFLKCWESSCGGYEDEKYRCTAPDCGYSWWVEGADA